ncbi:hypothetical protein LLG10_03715 [bacterium]|nr:hypothetical protein [bacterium]
MKKIYLCFTILLLTIFSYGNIGSQYYAEIVKISEIPIGKQNVIIPNINQSTIRSVPPPLLEIIDNQGNSYLMTLTKYPIFINKETKGSYTSHVPINYIVPSDEESYQIQFHPYDVFIHQNQFYWLNRSDKQLTLDQFTLELKEDGKEKKKTLQFEKKNHLDLLDMVNINIMDFIYVDMFGNVLTIADDHKIISIDIESYSIIWEKAIDGNWKVGTFKQIHDQLLVFEMISDDRKSRMIIGVDSYTGIEIWKKSKKAVSLFIIPVHYEFREENLFIESKGFINGFICLDVGWYFNIFDTDGEKIREVKIPKRDYDIEGSAMMFTNWHPITYNTDILIAENSIFLNYYGPQSVMIIIYHFNSNHFQVIMSKFTKSFMKVWSNPFIVNNNTILLIEYFEKSSRKPVNWNVKELKIPLFTDLVVLSSVHTINISRSVASNPIPIDDHSFVFSTDDYLYIYQYQIRKNE